MLPFLSNRDYLLNQQYRDGGNLNARIALHDRFSVNKGSWHRWIFDHFNLPAHARVLEIGAGVGRLWQENAERIPPGWSITLSDLSSGMLDEARHNVGNAHSFSFEVLDAQAIPYPDGTFDAVIANHMLYHVPDRPRALVEIYRVLAPTGLLYASTVGAGHLQELNELIRRWAPDLPDRGMPFTLENGRPQLDAVFPHVERFNYHDALEVTETEPLVAYILSMSISGLFVDDTLRDLTNTIDRDLAAHGSIHITKSSGLFVASK